MRCVLLGCVLFTMLCAGCGSTRSGRETAVVVTLAAYNQQASIATASVVASAKQTATVVRAPEIDQLNEAERKWQAAGVTRYRIRTHFEAEIYLDGTVEMQVENGQQTSVNCTSQPGYISGCSFLLTENYSVAGLFQRVRQELADPSVHLTVKYDAMYGFPRSIALESRTSTGWSDTTVEDFVILP